MPGIEALFGGGGGGSSAAAPPPAPASGGLSSAGGAPSSSASATVPPWWTTGQPWKQGDSTPWVTGQDVLQPDTVGYPNTSLATNGPPPAGGPFNPSPGDPTYPSGPPGTSPPGGKTPIGTSAPKFDSGTGLTPAPTSTGSPAGAGSTSSPFMNPNALSGLAMAHSILSSLGMGAGGTTSAYQRPFTKT